MLNISVFYSEYRFDYSISSHQKLIDLRKMISQTSLPLTSQLLSIPLNENEKTQLSNVDN